jgi:hypothetical protein
VRGMKLESPLLTDQLCRDSYERVADTRKTLTADEYLAEVFALEELPGSVDR